MAAGKKRALEETSGNPKAKKTKTDKSTKTKKLEDKPVQDAQAASTLVADDIDFPRGGEGNTSFQ